jgi:WD40 repeat protein
MRLLQASVGQVEQIAFSPCGKTLYSYIWGSNASNRIRCWSTESGEQISDRDLGPDPCSVEFASNAEVFAHLHRDSLRICKSLEEKETTRPLEEFSIGAMALSPDGRQIATATHLMARPYSWGSRIVVETVTGGQAQSSSFSSSIHVSRLAFAPNGRLLVSAGFGGAGGAFTVWDLANGESIVASSAPMGDRIKFSPESLTFGTVSGGIVFVRSSSTGKDTLQVSPQPEGPIKEFAFSPDGRILATSVARVVRFFSVSDGRRLNSYNWSIGNVTALAFAPDGLTAAAGSDRGQIVIWDVDA